MNDKPTKWIGEIVSELRKIESETEHRTDPKNMEVAYCFLHNIDWCYTYVTNCIVDSLNDLLKQNHPERYFELQNDYYRFRKYDTKINQMVQHSIPDNWKKLLVALDLEDGK